jgi:hypothetical protein
MLNGEKAKPEEAVQANGCPGTFLAVIRIMATAKFE